VSPTLDEVLRQPVAGVPAPVAEVLLALAGGCGDLAEAVAARHGAHVAPNADTGAGDVQAGIDVVADELFTGRLGQAPVRWVASEARPAATLLDCTAPIAVAIDPLDGSADLSTNAAVGTIFSLLRAAGGSPDATFHTAGTAQLAAGFVVYGPATTMVLTVGASVHGFVLDRSSGRWLLERAGLAIPHSTPEYAVNASNRRHWAPGLRAYIDDLVAGATGPRLADFDMRWTATLVAEANRILTRGGIVLYPADDRAGYEEGRLRLLHEAFPIALIVERAGGAATDGSSRLLDRVVGDLHQRTPLVFGSADKVARVAAYHDERFEGDRSPLFSARGLFRG